MKTVQELKEQERLIAELYYLFDLSCEESDLVDCLDELVIKNVEDFDKVFLGEESQFNYHQEIEDDMLDIFGEVIGYFMLNGIIFSTDELVDRDVSSLCQ